MKAYLPCVHVDKGPGAGDQVPFDKHLELFVKPSAGRNPGRQSMFNMVPGKTVWEFNEHSDLGGQTMVYDTVSDGGKGTWHRR